MCQEPSKAAQFLCVVCHELDDSPDYQLSDQVMIAPELKKGPHLNIFKIFLKLQADLCIYVKDVPAFLWLDLLVKPLS